MKIVFFGTPEFVIPVLQVLNKNFEVVGIVTTPDMPVGRKKTRTPTPVKKYALEHIPNALILNPKRLSSEITQKLIDLHPDFFVVAAYGLIIPKNILEIPRVSSINIHPSLLPKYRGPSPIQTALLNGEIDNGITLIEMDEEIDHGPILKKIPFEVEKDDNFHTLHTKMFQKSADELPQVLNDLKNKTLTPTPQDHTSATFTNHITRDDGFFDLKSPPEKTVLRKMINAYFPWPTAWTKVIIRDKELRLKFLPENKVQLEGGKPTPIKDFLNGHPELRSIIEDLLLNTKY